MLELFADKSGTLSCVNLLESECYLSGSGSPCMAGSASSFWRPWVLFGAAEPAFVLSPAQNSQQSQGVVGVYSNQFWISHSGLASI